MNSNFQEYKSVIKGAINKNEEIRKDISTVIDKGIDNIFFVGCGGSLAVMFPVRYILQLNSRIPCFIINAGEFNTLKPKVLSKKSLVILISSSGSTPEIIEAARFTKSIGCTTIGISSRTEPKLAKEVSFSYNFQIKTVGYSEYKLVVLYEIIFYILNKLDNFSDYDEIINSLKYLPDGLTRVNKQVENKSIQFAKEYRGEKIFYTIGAGICWGQAYSFAICKLEEMQWLTSQPIHAGEYFHGPFEVIDEKSTLLIFKGEDPSRSLIDRVINFSKGYTKKMVIIDTEDFSLPGVSKRVRGYFSPFILTVVLNSYAEHLAKERKHPLSTRRYMGKVEY
ncbi:MAG: SIS domain-containing protein [Candidatus Helarchaeota archaeon]